MADALAGEQVAELREIFSLISIDKVADGSSFYTLILFVFTVCFIYNLDLNNWASCCNSICFVSVYKFVLYTGFITLEEMATIVQSLDRRPTIEEIRDMICEVYIDGNGTLHFEEFLNVMGRKQKVNNNMKWISIGAFICKCLLFSLWDYR